MRESGHRIAPLPHQHWILGGFQRYYVSWHRRSPLILYHLHLLRSSPTLAGPAAASSTLEHGEVHTHLRHDLHHSLVDNLGLLFLPSNQFGGPERYELGCGHLWRCYHWFDGLLYGSWPQVLQGPRHPGKGDLNSIQWRSCLGSKRRKSCVLCSFRVYCHSCNNEDML